MNVRDILQLQETGESHCMCCQRAIELTSEGNYSPVLVEELADIEQRLIEYHQVNLSQDISFESLKSLTSMRRDYGTNVGLTI